MKNTGGRTSKYQNKDSKDDGEPGSAGPVQGHSATAVYPHGEIFFVASG